MQSQIERRYARHCDPACPSCLGLGGRGEIGPHRALLAAYCDYLAQAVQVPLDEAEPEALRTRLAERWKAKKSTARIRFDDGAMKSVAELIAYLTVHQIPGAYRDIDATVAWTRTRGFGPDRYQREVGLYLGSGR